MQKTTVQRFGQVIGLKSTCIQAYRDLHDGSGVRDLLTAANIRNFNIFLTEMPDGKTYEFAFYEYVGDNYDEDMARLAVDPRNQEWLKICDPMQFPLPGEDSWRQMENVFYNP
ncbi:L-rhamnose mutarotase [Falsihalocynthiibacter arcticus]|uniref:L-rhamnose 1-epimerase n=1 Tax=Falsihalocynthiibacter arcticus TaxID=1579316 RepID=A0A126V120_9RHOB|nr:L-rhamnose mutarotase [Falsihalocynthiibacter arcticus]AML51847.1 hypothetical protein RC74_11740 [Falsihalocynthiibacter arcticus]